MKKIYITRQLEESVVEKLKQKFEVSAWSESKKAVPRDELLKSIRGVDGILCMLTEKIDAELIDAAGPQLKTVSTMSVGFDHVDLAALKDRGITLGYTPDVLSAAVADMTVALMLNAGRRIPESIKAAKRGKWGDWSPYWMTGQDLSGATVGLIGMGHIAEEVAKRLKGFGCNIVYHSQTPRLDLEQSLRIKHCSFDELLAESDFVSMHVPLTPETKDMCGSDMFRKMKNSAVFINTSRGGVVCQDDLYEALKNKEIYAAGIDVTMPEPLPANSPLYQLENCIITPHIASASIKTRTKMGDIAANNLIAGLEGQPLMYQVDV